MNHPHPFTSCILFEESKNAGSADRIEILPMSQKLAQVTRNIKAYLRMNVLVNCQGLHVTVECVTILLHIREVTDSNLASETGYPY
jgi:hypothetical protein